MIVAGILKALVVLGLAALALAPWVLGVRGQGLGNSIRFVFPHPPSPKPQPPRRCRVCGCTDDDCSGCIERTGHPCCWVEDDLCSACVLLGWHREG